MKYIFLLMMVGFLSCKNDNKEIAVADAKINENLSQTELEVYDFDGLEKFLSTEDNKTYVVNFWATWCAPCIKELPHFESLNAEYKSRGVEVILVSLDFPKQYDKKLKPFIEQHNLQSKVIALDDTDSNSWIPKVDQNWSGAIPATLIFNKDKREFYEGLFNYEQLQNEVKQFLN